MRPLKNMAAWAALLLAFCGCSSDDMATKNTRQTVINATMENTQHGTRTCVDPDTYNAEGFVGLLWTKDDAIGVFSETDANARFGNSSSASSPKTDFSGQIAGTPLYAYYPYSEANAGRKATELTGEIHAVQQYEYATGLLSDDYKIGVPETGSTSRFSFKHLFSLLKMDIDATATSAEGERLDYVQLDVTAPDGAERAIAGTFNFDATGASPTAYSNVAEGSASIKMEWTDTPALEQNKRLAGFITAIPDIHAGDKFTIKVVTNKRIMSYEVSCRLDFHGGYVYNFPIELAKYEGKAEYGWTEELRSDIEYDVQSGTFKCASMNVDGLPQKINGITINGDGPGSEGTKVISQAIANAGWDFFAVSEDFAYDTELRSALSAYGVGTYRGSISAEQLIKKADTDGMNFFWKKDGLAAANETFVEYNDAEGGLTGGANTCIAKGFRHYEVTVADGVMIDVYITHMNTYSGSGNTESNAYVKAVLSQLRQLRDYVVANVLKNRRPAIVMGDTNMRYTRHDIKTNLIDALPADVTFNDPWVDFHRGGIFPAWNTKSLMIPSKFEGDTKNDIVCSDDQRGEVVDKIWYFNHKNAEVQLNATGLINDVSDNFTASTSNASYSGVTVENADGTIVEGTSVSYTKRIGIADHFPVVGDFTWTRKVAKQD